MIELLRLFATAFATACLYRGIYEHMGLTDPVEFWTRASREEHAPRRTGRITSRVIVPAIAMMAVGEHVVIVGHNLRQALHIKHLVCRQAAMLQIDLVRCSAVSYKDDPGRWRSAIPKRNILFDHHVGGDRLTSRVCPYPGWRWGDLERHQEGETS